MASPASAAATISTNPFSTRMCSTGDRPASGAPPTGCSCHDLGGRKHRGGREGADDACIPAAEPRALYNRAAGDRRRRSLRQEPPEPLARQSLAFPHLTGLLG